MEMTTAEKYSIALTEKWAYAAPAFALAVLGIPIYVYIPKFYTDVVGINITILGYLMFSVRIFDAVTDPVIGYISDRTQFRFGRRRPYIAVGSIMVAAAMYLLFNPPAATASLETVWFGVFIYLLFLFWTAVVVPFESMGSRLRSRWM
jgi:GPH family glycoside/pentoside/hexuronide:cation symporter